MHSSVVFGHFWVIYSSAINTVKNIVTGAGNQETGEASTSGAGDNKDGEPGTSGETTGSSTSGELIALSHSNTG